MQQNIMYLLCHIKAVLQRGMTGHPRPIRSGGWPVMSFRSIYYDRSRRMGGGRWLAGCWHVRSYATQWGIPASLLEVKFWKTRTYLALTSLVFNGFSKVNPFLTSTRHEHSEYAKILYKSLLEIWLWTAKRWRRKKNAIFS